MDRSESARAPTPTHPVRPDFAIYSDSLRDATCCHVNRPFRVLHSHVSVQITMAFGPRGGGDRGVDVPDRGVDARGDDARGESEWMFRCVVQPA